MKKFLWLILMFSALTFTFYISPVYADCDPNDPNFGPCPAGLTEIEEVFSNIISVVVGLGFIAMLMMLVWSGFQFLVSGGEPKALQAARQASIWAILGIVFMIAAWLILQLIASFTGLPVTVFNIKTLL
ncbi:pilin [Patescibacteria group bacterium]|nr:pilin [Patescibacteria group bacterium]